MALRFISAEEAASYINHDDVVGFSGFTPAGAVKAIPVAIGEKAKLEQRLQDKVQQHLGTGSSTTDPNAPSVEEQLKQKVEDELKQKLKGLF